MVPDHSLFEALVACVVAITPKDHTGGSKEGSLVLKKIQDVLLLQGKAFFSLNHQMEVDRRRQYLSTGSASTQTYRSSQSSGYSEGLSNMYTSELRAKWLAHFMGGGGGWRRRRRLQAAKRRRDGERCGGMGRVMKALFSRLLSQVLHRHPSHLVQRSALP
ncbi:hypothetical protein GUJ93_ZPchr0586g11362 [Zizania palustris]|uniref:Uncharacterized protein n=1 Tax=Zizania palustris TaxID=103762 RepID=A0A8J5VDE7_ZIZPA|nr:hypothetical protein GUJ93_ZPchr0586g11362 [Zizania palustris]